MKLKEAPSLKGKKFREWYDNKVPSNGTKVNVAMAVYPEHLTDRSAFLDKVDTEEDYVREVSELINTFDEIMDENSVILISGYGERTDFPMRSMPPGSQSCLPSRLQITPSVM